MSLVCFAVTSDCMIPAEAASAICDGGKEKGADLSAPWSWVKEGLQQAKGGGVSAAAERITCGDTPKNSTMWETSV